MSKTTKTIPLIILLLGLLSLVTGISFSLFTSDKESDKIQVIKSGIISLELKETGDFNFDDITEKTDSDGYIQEKYHDFTVNNIGDADATYKIYLLDNSDELVTFDGELLDSQYIRVGLEVNGVQNKVVSLSDDNRLIATGEIKKGDTINFRLRLWLNFTNLSDDEIASFEGSKLFLKLKVEAEQLFQDEEELNSSNS